MFVLVDIRKITNYHQVWMYDFVQNQRLQSFIFEIKMSNAKNASGKIDQQSSGTEYDCIDELFLM